MVEEKLEEPNLDIKKQGFPLLPELSPCFCLFVCLFLEEKEEETNLPPIQALKQLLLCHIHKFIALIDH